MAASVAQAATLSFSESNQTYSLGDTIEVALLVSSDTSINGIQADIEWPAGLLRLESITTDDTLLDFWVSEPAQRSVSRAGFEGVILNPGYAGADGHVVRLRFKARSLGSGVVDFTSAAVLANDGVGTNVLTAAVPSSFNIVSPVVPIHTAPVQPATVPDVVDPAEPVSVSTTSISLLETYVVTHQTQDRICQIENNEVVVCSEIIIEKAPAPQPAPVIPPAPEHWCAKIGFWWIPIAILLFLCGWLIGRRRNRPDQDDSE